MSRLGCFIDLAIGNCRAEQKISYIHARGALDRQKFTQYSRPFLRYRNENSYIGKNASHLHIPFVKLVNEAFSVSCSIICPVLTRRASNDVSSCRANSLKPGSSFAERTVGCSCFRSPQRITPWILSAWPILAREIQLLGSTSFGSSSRMRIMPFAHSPKWRVGIDKPR